MKQWISLLVGSVLVATTLTAVGAGEASADGSEPPVPVIGSYVGVSEPAGGLSKGPATGSYTENGPDLYEINVVASSSGGVGLTIYSRHPFHVGLYTYTDALPQDPSEDASLGVAGDVDSAASGYVRVLQIKPGKTPADVQFAATYVLGRGRNPTYYGSVGLNTLIPLAVPGETAKAKLGDFDGNGATDVAVFRPSTGQWFIRGHAPIGYGRRGDVPVPGDYDGNGATDIAVFRPSTGQWFIRGRAQVSYGRRGDTPTQADYDGHGTTDIALFRPSTGQWFVRGTPTVVVGRSGDAPVPGPYWCGIPPCPYAPSQRAVFRPSTAHWFFEQPQYEVTPNPYAHAGDIPVPGSYGTNYQNDLVTFRPSTGLWTLPKAAVHFGAAGDIPV